MAKYTTPCCFSALDVDRPPIQWNPGNGVMQCHSCGSIYVPASAMNRPAEAIDVWALCSPSAAAFASGYPSDGWEDRMAYALDNPPGQLQPQQPLMWRDNVASFRGNSIVCFLYDRGRIDLAELDRMSFAAADREQFCQLLGFSVGSLWSFNYVCDRTKIAACDAYKKLVDNGKPASRETSDAYRRRVLRETSSLLSPVALAGYLSEDVRLNGEPPPIDPKGEWPAPSPAAVGPGTCSWSGNSGDVSAAPLSVLDSCQDGAR